jgi:hypothetical protein
MLQNNNYKKLDMCHYCWESYGMRRESSTLNCNLKAQHSMQHAAVTAWGNLQEQNLQCHNSAWQFNPHKRYSSQSSHWDLLDHPPHRPDPAPSDYHAFGPQKQHLGCHWPHSYVTTWKQLFKNCCKCQSWNYTVLEFLELCCHDGANTTVLNVITFSWNKWAAFNIVTDYHLVFMNYETLLTKHTSSFGREDLRRIYCLQSEDRIFPLKPCKTWYPTTIAQCHVLAATLSTFTAVRNPMSYLLMCLQFM